MGIGEIGDVDVVTDTGAIWGVVVVTEDSDGGSFANGGIEHQGHQVCLGIVVFAGVALQVGTCCVEVT